MDALTSVLGALRLARFPVAELLCYVDDLYVCFPRPDVAAPELDQHCTAVICFSVIEWLYIVQQLEIHEHPEKQS